LRADWALRIGLLAAVLAAAALGYFGLLHIVGIRLREFARRT
jgi:hypothetical protein